ncbi:MAG: NAD-dependent dehydratase [Rhodospirillaceae bacterium]|nr:NAD-dependent dehydratase [Rhodospirillaceae bacterium]HAA93484.1 NAD-dependent dehydratase [Rhodospirillaceae bacterium]|tara:strand:+ start:274 stop:1176 length:903 start_codon:yes stop_codon:yes gene_type:complete
MTRLVLVTGAGGFIGRHLTPVLENAGWNVRGIGRKETGDLDGNVDWQPYLEGVESVVHLAARVHAMGDRADNPDALSAHLRANRDATGKLGEQAESLGVRKFVFLSSVKVHGEASELPLQGNAPVDPLDPYGRSKADAEQALLASAKQMNVTILRPPLVYGPFVKGNFRKLLNIVDKGVPLPLGATDNRRSLIYVGNLADAIRVALDAPPGIHLPSDGDPISTTALIRELAQALDRPARLIPVPVPLLRVAGHLTGKSNFIQRLVDSFVVDGTIPDWQPPYSLQQGLAETAAWWRKGSEN